MANVYWVECSCACCASTREVVEALIAERDQARGDVEPLRASCYELEERVIQSTREIDVWQERFEVMREAWRKIAATAERERDEALRVQEALRLKAKNLARERDEWKVEAHTQAELYRERCRERNEALGNAVFWKAQHDTKEALLFDKAQRFERERDEALEKARWANHIAECRGKEIVSREEVIEQLQNERDEAELRLTESTAAFRQVQHERNAAETNLADLNETTETKLAKYYDKWFEAERERDEARADLAKAEGYAVYLSQAWRSDCIVDELAGWLEEAQAHCDARNNT
jgi:chromosome segregation ATPase